MNLNELSKEELIKIIEENENTSGKYGLVWDKEREPELIVTECNKSIPILNEIEVIKNNSAKNFNYLIKGDNFHSLSVLNYTHKEKVDVIYIDPPYNRGKQDLIYNDKYVDINDGYRHSKWLNFMEKRLKLAKDLLKEDGVILISIDDNEFAQLKLLCDKIFNYKNYVGEFIRKTKSSTNDADSFFNQQHDFCLVYKKGNFQFDGVEKELSGYKNPDNDPNGDWKSSDPSAKSGGPSTYFEIKNPITGQIDLPPKGRYWAFSKESLKKYIEIGKIKFKEEQKNGERGFIFKSYKNNLRNLNKPVDSLMFDDNLYMNQVATKEINDLDIEFDYPKPVEFIKKIIASIGNKNSTILDFFAGTGTTAQAVFELNKEDGGNRQVIICTNNENNIFDNATYPRIKKTIMDNNLIYYETAFVENTNNRDQLYFDLTERCIPMLCMKSECFEEYKSSDEYKIFTNGDKTKYACVYYSLFGEKEEEFIEELRNIKEEKYLYKFTLGDTPDMTKYKDLTNYEVEAIPYKIVELYKKIVKMSRED